MAEVVQGAQQEFWRPPSPMVADAPVALQALPSLATACRRCGTEFLTGSRFCHSCGGSRLEAHSVAQAAGFIPVVWSHVVHGSSIAWSAWRKIEFPSWLRYLHFHEIKNSVGLPTASLIAFVIGVGCVAGALLVGLLTAKSLID